MHAKQAAGEAAVQYVEDGMIVGLGTGSTVYYCLMKLAELVRDGLNIMGIPTSDATRTLALEQGIPLTNFRDHPVLDVVIDGADAVDPAFSLIKGGGAAHLREKLVASCAKKMVVVADASKRYQTFNGLPIPVEVVPFAWETTEHRIIQLGGHPKLRCSDNGQPIVTDNHNYILDTAFDVVEDAGQIHNGLKQLTGVVETGLFVGFASVVIYGNEDGAEVVSRPQF